MHGCPLPEISFPLYLMNGESDMLGFGRRAPSTLYSTEDLHVPRTCRLARVCGRIEGQ